MFVSGSRFHFKEEPDPHQSDANLQPLTYRPSTPPGWAFMARGWTCLVHSWTSTAPCASFWRGSVSGDGLWHWCGSGSRIPKSCVIIVVRCIISILFSLLIFFFRGTGVRQAGPPRPIQPQLVRHQSPLQQQQPSPRFQVSTYSSLKKLLAMKYGRALSEFDYSVHSLDVRLPVVWFGSGFRIRIRMDPH